MNELKTNYKGFEITYNENSDKWEYQVKENHYGKENLSDVKKKIEEFLKKENAFERFEALRLGTRSGELFSRVTVTSKTEDGYYWVSGEKGRSKEHGRYLAKITPENEKLVEHYREQEAIWKNAQIEMTETLKKIERI